MNEKFLEFTKEIVNKNIEMSLILAELDGIKRELIVQIAYDTSVFLFERLRFINVDDASRLNIYNIVTLMIFHSMLLVNDNVSDQLAKSMGVKKEILNNEMQLEAISKLLKYIESNKESNIEIDKKEMN